MKRLNTIKLMRDSLKSLALGIWLAAGSALAAPANDDFANAIDLTGAGAGQTGDIVIGTQTGTNTAAATLQVDEPNPGATNTVWFKWTCPADGNFTYDTFGSTNPGAGQWDSIIGIYTGTALNALTPLGATPKDTVVPETMTVPVTAGITYHIQLAGYANEEAANIQLNWNFAATVYPADILTFGPGAVVGGVVANAADIAWTLPFGTNLATLAPTFTLSPGATCTVGGSPVVSGSTVDFSGGPVDFTVTAQGVSPIVNVYTVTVTFAPNESALIWDLVGGGDWDFITANWLGQTSSTLQPFSNLLNVIFNKTSGGTINIPASVSPLSTTVSATSGTYTFSGGPIATGSLTKGGGGTLVMAKANTYDGGTVITNGTLQLNWPGDGVSHTTLGSGPVTLDGGTLYLFRVDMANPLTINGGTLVSENGFGNTWTGPITLNVPLNCNIQWPLTCSGNIGGVGGLSISGSNQFGRLKLSGTNSYEGPTTVTGSTLEFGNINALPSGVLSISSGGAKVALNFSGTKSITSLTLGGVEQITPGTYGSSTSTADFKSAYFSDDGMVQVGDPAFAAAINSFGTNIPGSAAIIEPVVANAAAITWFVPFGTNLATLAPAFLMTAGSTCSDQTSGVIPTPGFDAGPVVYTIVSQNTLVTNVYTVTATVLPDESTLIWDLASGGAWNFTNANWRGLLSGFPTPYFDGVNVIFDKTAGGTINLDGNLSPLTTTVNAASGTYTFSVVTSGGAITTGSLTKDGAGTLLMAKANSYAGGTTITNGTLKLEWPGDGVSHTTLGSGPVILDGGTLHLNRVDLANALTVNGGNLIADNGFSNSWTGPITINAPNVDITAYYTPNHLLSGAISGSGGFTLSSVAGGGLALSGTNDYTGPTTVTGGTLRIDNTAALSGSSALSISGSGTMNLNYGGTKIVASLSLGGVPQTLPGTYGSVLSGAEHPSDTYFTGSGTVTLVAASADYTAWLAEFTFAPGDDTTATGDPDGDGMTNEEEYAFGLNPTLGSSVNPIIEGLDPLTGNFKYTRRATPATSGFTYTVQTSTDLEVWPPGNATEINVTTAGTIETVTVNVTALPVGGRLFVRVSALP